MALAEGLPGWPTRLPACQRDAHCLRLFAGHGARPSGILVLTRDATQHPFTVRDEHLLLRLAEYLNKGIQTQRNQRAPYVNSGESGLLVFDEGGAVHQSCAAGRRLLLQAACPSLPAGTDGAAARCVESLGIRLVQSFAGEAQPAACLQNDWGLFEFRPHRLTLGNGRSGGLGVRVIRHEPLALRLMRGMTNLDLSSRQKEAVLLLAYGYSHRDMAERMGVSYHTAIDHVRKLYDKLGVRETPHLLERVMGGGDRKTMCCWPLLPLFCPPRQVVELPQQAQFGQRLDDAEVEGGAADPAAGKRQPHQRPLGSVAAAIGFADGGALLRVNAGPVERGRRAGHVHQIMIAVSAAASA
jgi:DNA-binding CsgD family transcriptional regulator